MSMTEQETHRTSAVDTAAGGRGFVVAGIVCAVAALFVAPILLGPAGAVLGFVGYGKGDRRGLWVGIASIVATVVGIALAAALLNNR